MTKNKIKTFNLFEIKQKLDEERYERNKDRKETIGEKVLKLFVVFLGSIMLISLFWSFSKASIPFYMFVMLNIAIWVFVGKKIFYSNKN